jgi:hypothetical protein
VNSAGTISKPGFGSRFKRTAALSFLIAVSLFVAIKAFTTARTETEQHVEAWLDQMNRQRGVGVEDYQPIERMGPAAIPILVATLAKQDSVARRRLLTVNRRLPAPIQNHHVRSADTDRMLATLALMDTKYGGDAVSLLIPVLRDSDEEVRLRVAEILSELTSIRDAAWLPQLNGSLTQEKSKYIQIRLATAIGRIKPDSEVVANIVEAALNQPEPLFRRLAKECLDGIEEQRTKQNANGQNP